MRKIERYTYRENRQAERQSQFRKAFLLIQTNKKYPFIVHCLQSVCLSVALLIRKPFMMVGGVKSWAFVVCWPCFYKELPLKLLVSILVILLDPICSTTGKNYKLTFDCTIFVRKCSYSRLCVITLFAAWDLTIF